jgi:hypothetical protein
MGRSKVFLELQAKLQLVVFCKIASLECIIQEAKLVEMVGAKSGLQRGWGLIIHPIAVIASLVRKLVCSLALSYGRRWTWFIFLFGRTLRILSGIFFIVGEYVCVLNVAPLSNILCIDCGGTSLQHSVYPMWRHLSPTIPITRTLHCPGRLLLWL